MAGGGYTPDLGCRIVRIVAKVAQKLSGISSQSQVHNTYLKKRKTPATPIKSLIEGRFFSMIST
jgi:hypothetical protein